MNKVVAILFLLAWMIPAFALADVDLSGMSYDELVALKDQINKAIWDSEKWEEVTVPQGVWKVGEDIPAGHWTIKAADGALASIEYGDILADDQRSISYKSKGRIYEQVYSPTRKLFDENSDKVQIDIEMKDGYYVCIDHGSVVFSPYSGKVSLGFSGFGGAVHADSTPAPTDAPVDADGYVAFDYEKAARNPDDHIGDKYIITGEVVQAMGSDIEGYTFRVATGEYSSDVVMLYGYKSNMPEYKILENDEIIAKCIFKGEYTYESVLGQSITVPYALIYSIELKD